MTMRLINILLPFVVLACTPGSTDSAGSGQDDAVNVDVDSLSWTVHDDIGSLVYVTWNQTDNAAVHVEYSFDADVWLSSPTIDAVTGTNETLLAGIPYALTAEWRVVVENGNTFPGSTITTDDAPFGLPLPELRASNPEAWFDGGNYLLMSINRDAGHGWNGGEYWTVIVDRQGRPVWAHAAPDGNWTLFTQISVTGDYFLWDEATAWSKWDDGRGSTVHRTYLDEEIDEVATPGLHHAFVQLPDESIVWGSKDHGGREALVKKGPAEAGDGTVIWSCQADWPGAQNCESNGLFYKPKTDTFLYSFYTNNSVVEIDHQTGESLWWAGENNNNDSGRKYSFSPSDSQFNWQHGVWSTDEGTMLVSTQSWVPGDWSGYDSGSTIVREYIINHDDKQLESIWSYESNVYAPYNGDSMRLANGNTLHVIGCAGHVKEVDPDGETVWHIDYNGMHNQGHAEFIEDLYTLVSPSPSASQDP